MAKQSGLGDNLYIEGRNFSGDIGSIGSISGGKALLDVTGIDKSAMERIGGVRTGTIEFTAFFNDALQQAHAGLKSLVTTDRHVTYFRGTAIGNPAASMVAKQINYDPTRGADGSLTMAVQALSNGYGLEWGIQLTAGSRTDASATNGASYDTGASASFGGQAYCHMFAFTGTDVTVKIQDSADDSSWADVATFAFPVFTSGEHNTAERIALSNTATIRRYVRAVTTTSGGFTTTSFAVMLVKNAIADQVF